MENKSSLVVSNILRHCCYATAVFTMMVTLAVIIKPVKTAMSERESVRAEIQQSIDKAGLNGLIELE